VLQKMFFFVHFFILTISLSLSLKMAANNRMAELRVRPIR